MRLISERCMFGELRPGDTYLLESPPTDFDVAVLPSLFVFMRMAGPPLGEGEETAPVWKLTVGEED